MTDTTTESTPARDRTPYDECRSAKPVIAGVYAFVGPETPLTVNEGRLSIGGADGGSIGIHPTNAAAMPVADRLDALTVFLYRCLGEVQRARFAEGDN